MRTYIRFIGVLSAACASIGHALAQGGTEIQLLEPIGGADALSAQDGQPFGLLGQYFGLMYPWLVGTAAGLVLLWAVVSGIMIMIKGAEPGERQKWIDHLLHALLGLLLIIFSGVILHAINPAGFQ